MTEYRGHDKFAGEEADGREGAVGEEREGGEGVDGCINVSEALKPPEVPVLVTVPDRAVPAEEDLH